MDIKSLREASGMSKNTTRPGGYEGRKRGKDYVYQVQGMERGIHRMVHAYLKSYIDPKYEPKFTEIE